MANENPRKLTALEQAELQLLMRSIENCPCDRCGKTTGMNNAFTTDGGQLIGVQCSDCTSTTMMEIGRALCQGAIRMNDQTISGGSSSDHSDTGNNGAATGAALPGATDSAAGSLPRADAVDERASGGALHHSDAGKHRNLRDKIGQRLYDAQRANLSYLAACFTLDRADLDETICIFRSAIFAYGREIELLESRRRRIDSMDDLERELPLNERIGHLKGMQEGDYVFDSHAPG